MALEITSVHKEEYERDGYTIVKSGFDADECDRFIDYMMDIGLAYLSMPVVALGFAYSLQTCTKQHVA